MDLSKLSKPKLIELIMAERSAFAAAFVAGYRHQASSSAKETVAVYCSECGEFETFDSLDKAQAYIAKDIKDTEGNYNEHTADSFTVVVGREVSVKSDRVVTFD